MAELTQFDASPIDRSPESQQEGNPNEENRQGSSNQDSDEENQEGNPSDQGSPDGGEQVEGEEEEEVSECGFCLFMKSGPCRDSFIKWEECVEQAEKAKEDIVEKCHQVTFLLKECMDHNSDYYEPVLKAEKAMGEAALEEAAALQEGNTSPDPQVPSEAEAALEEADALQEGNASPDPQVPSEADSSKHQDAPAKETHPPE